VITTIYARQTGNDTTGNGTLANPYRTFQRAIRDVPPLILPGNQFNVDVTNLGLEVFPPGYQLPQIQASSLVNTWIDNPLGPFSFTTPLNIVATPQPVAAIPLADTLLPAGSYTVTADPDTGLGTVTLTGPARASWGTDGLKGKMIIGTAAQSFPQADVSCVIYTNTTSSISVANYASSMAGDLQIVEPSATFQGEQINPGQSFTGQTFYQGGSIQAIGANAIAFQGIRFTNTDPTNIWAGAYGASKTPRSTTRPPVTRSWSRVQVRSCCSST
jgi:hypothetical protein